MNSMFYPRLALSNIKKNRKTYYPYLLTCILTVMLYYIMNTLARNEGLKKMPGAGSLTLIMSWAGIVVAIFAVIFLFYTNSFLVKQRKKEFGLYQVLGMDKRNITKMMTWETIYTTAISLGAGLLGGILFGRLMFLFLLKLIHFEVPLAFAVEGKSVWNTLMLFLFIFAASFLSNLFQVSTVNPVQLLQGGKQGEREPKAKWFIALIGFICLGTGYYIALTTESPLSAIGKFFIAVILVIIGTYFLFTAGSIVFLKMLRKNKKFYYNTKHFISVSGMIYRMKQNAVGLANICILSTIVLVLISTSVSMYAGMGDVMDTMYPTDVYIKNFEGSNQEYRERIEQIIEEESGKYGVKVENQTAYKYGSLTVIQDKDELLFEENKEKAYSTEAYCELDLIALEEYNRLENDQMTLGADDVIVYDTRGEFSSSALEMQGKRYNVAKIVKSMNIVNADTANVVPALCVVVPDENVIWELMDMYTDQHYNLYYTNMFDLDGKEENCQKAAASIGKRIRNEVTGSRVDVREEEWEGMFEIFGGFLFLGIFLGSMFMMATVLIIYYKQISEGMDDKDRYQIMQKVGMSRQEVRKTIRSQILLVFFLPIITAVIHIAAAFKVITKLLAIFNLVNVPLFLGCTIVTVIVFSIIYAIVFGITAKEYYKIVQ